MNSRRSPDFDTSRKVVSVRFISASSEAVTGSMSSTAPPGRSVEITCPRFVNVTIIADELVAGSWVDRISACDTEVAT